jgi:hypothetical protein
VERVERQSNGEDDGGKQDRRIDKTDEEEHESAWEFVRAEKLTMVAEDDGGQMNNVPLQGDGGVLTCRGKGMAICRIADDPEIYRFGGKRQKERESENVEHIQVPA